MHTTDNFDQWKDYLSQNVTLAKQAGTSEETIVNMATKLGNLLAAQVDPANREQRLLKELWDKGDEQDRKSLAKMITKMVSDGTKH
jgi:hypothetical protein